MMYQQRVSGRVGRVEEREERVVDRDCIQGGR